MIYGEKVRYAREKLGLSRMEFAIILGMTERSLGNVENCKDGSIKLSYDRMDKIIEIAKLPKGWWFYNAEEIQAYLIAGAEIFVRGNEEVTEEEAKEISRIISDIS